MYQESGRYIQCDICVGCTAQRASRPECDIGENFNMNEYLNILVSNILYQQMSKFIWIFFLHELLSKKLILALKFVRIYEYIRMFD